ncbi:MAG TPA: HIT family protein [bacterium]|nr:HIT family protein [bacterium]
MAIDAACSICNRLDRWHRGENPYVIHEFPHSLWVVGDHQFHPGYTLLLLKEHVRELHELPRGVQLAFFDEVMTAGQVIVDLFQPWKMNYSCYGNLDPHLHWHLFPRRADDPDRTGLPWKHADRFGGAAIGAEEAQALATRIRVGLAG